MTELWRDVRYGVRTLRRNPGYAAVIVLTLGLGIGANTAIFSVIHGVLLQPLPFEHGDRLVHVRQEAALNDVESIGVSAQELGDYREASRSTDGLVEYHTMWFNLLGHGDPERVQTGVVSWNYFEVMGVRPILGRAFRADEDQLGAEPVVVLGYEYWQQRFGGDRDVIGRTVEMNDRIHTIVGVMPPFPQYPNDNDVWMPWYACPFRSGERAMENRQARMLTLIGRMKAGFGPRDVESDLDAVAAAMSSEHPEAYTQVAGFGTTVTPLREEMTSEARPTFLILLGMSGLVLLIACANVANLTLARMTNRERELAVRSAMGAGRGRLVRQLVTESTLLSLLGGGLGLALALAVSGLLVRFAAQFTPRAHEVAIDGPVLLFTVGAALVTGLVVGVVPTLFFGRDVYGALREGGRSATAGAGRQRLRSALVVGELALALVLLVGAGLMARSLFRLHQVDAGFDAGNVLTMRLDLDFTTRMQAEDRLAFYEPLEQRVRELPGVTRVGLTNQVPLNGGLPNAPLEIEGRPQPEQGQTPQVGFRLANPDYFEALRIPLLKGRYFSAGDHADAPAVAILSGRTARTFWGDEDPLGDRISFGGQNSWTVVGVVGDVLQESLADDVEHEIYLAFAQNPPLGASLAVRTRGEPTALTRQITETVHAIDPRQPVAFVQTMAEVREAVTASPRLTTMLLALFAGLALVISVAGIAGLIAYTVSQRTHEMGIRLALGARPGALVRNVVLRGVVLVLAGLALGVVAALAVGRLMAGLLYQVEPGDPATLVAVSLVLLLAGALAAYLPARRIAAVDPVRAFRAD